MKKRYDQLIYLDGLNGLRAIAALAVLFSHTTSELANFGLSSFVFGKYPDGTPITTLLAGFGVTIFFALSGFLITYLLLHEHKWNTTINIKNFYIRRILRIWPLYYAYLVLSILTLILFKIDFRESFILYYVFMASNVPFIMASEIPFLGHYWSLGVEEQFYSFWPWVIKRTNSMLVLTIMVFISLILIKCALRYIDIRFHDGNSTWPYLSVHVTRFHCMLMGAIGAIFYFRRDWRFLKMMNNYPIQLSAWLVIFLALFNKFHVASFLDNELIAVVTVVLIVGQIEKSHRVLNLENRALNFIGRISYGIYVLHPLIIFYAARAVGFFKFTPGYFAVYVSIFFVTIFVSYLSFEFFEKKFLVMKVKYDSLSKGT